MNNTVFIRSKNSIFTISLIRILSLLPFVLIGVYLNTFKINDLSPFNFIKPLIYSLVGMIIGLIVNLIFTKKQKKDRLSDILFSSFHIECGIIIGALMSSSVSLIVFSIVLTILFIISKLVDIKVNTMALTFIIIYLITKYTNGFEYVIRNSLSDKDYFIGNVTGGLLSTGLIPFLISLFILRVNSSSKTDISIYACITYVVLCLITHFIMGNDFYEIVFKNSYLFIFLYIASDSISSSYTLKGVKVYGILIGLITFILSFISPILAPFIAILITSLFHTFIDKYSNKLLKKKLT
jgi:Na+-translocating ferredoxin:NAD+ oxidoreductase RnfD subunit